MTEEELAAIERRASDALFRGKLLKPIFDDTTALLAECRRQSRILAAIAAEVRLQCAHLDEYSDRFDDDELEDRHVLLATFGNLAAGVGPDGREIT